MATVFLSYRRSEQADADALRTEQLEGWTVTSHPVEPGAGARWQEQCRRSIASADAVACIVGEHTAESPNVDWELETAYALGRPVVGVRAAGAVAPRLPAPLAARGASLADPGEVAERLAGATYERIG